MPPTLEPALGTSRRDFVLANTRLQRPERVPELRLHLADDVTILWQAIEEELGKRGVEPPYWASAWAGGQAVARLLLDRPALVSGRRVLDLASGSGLCAIAAMRAGAASVAAVDVDEFSMAAIEENALVNAVLVEPVLRDLLGGEAPDVDVVLAGDVSYERRMADRMYGWLRRCRDAGADVLVGDPGRAFLPQSALVEVARYDIVSDPTLENVGVRHASVYRLG